MSRIISLLLILLSVTAGCNQKSSLQNKGLQGELIIFHAGSLSVPIKALADSFNILHPDLIIKPESAGSLTCIRKITELDRDCDILASSDAVLIDKLMIPEYADWNLEFAVNEIAIVYHPGSKMADKITTENWPDILLLDDVITGRSDPSSDPCGYRTVLSVELAEMMLKKPGLAAQLLAKDHKYIRPKEMDLIALLETNSVDYIFLYKSVALQHELPFLELSDSINLGNPILNNWYARVSVEVPGNSPKDKIIQQGEAMVYGITIPLNSPNRQAAQEFIHFILTDGQDIIRNCYQTPISPARISATSKPPSWLVLSGK